MDIIHIHIYNIEVEIIEREVEKEKISKDDEEKKKIQTMDGPPKIGAWWWSRVLQLHFYFLYIILYIYR